MAYQKRFFVSGALKGRAFKQARKDAARQMWTHHRRHEHFLRLVRRVHVRTGSRIRLKTGGYSGRVDKATPERKAYRMELARKVRLARAR